MDKEKWNRLMHLFEQALELPPVQQLKFIDEACGEDQGLKQELIALIEATEREQESSFFDKLSQEVNPLYAGAPDHRLNQTFAHYKVIQQIGRGGMGVVYLAFDQKLRRNVALKFLPEHLLLDTEVRQRFLNEARAAASLDHPNICTIFEINEVHDSPFISMAYVEGQSLKQALVQGQLDIAEMLRLSIQICEGLQSAHDHHIIHRDIKPANLMLNTHGRLVIMDFGLAKLPGTEDLSKSGTTRGTVAYMSPEQARGREVDPRSDLWSLGIVMFEMLTGVKPFNRKSEYDLIQAIISEPTQRIEDIRSGVPKELRALILKLLSKKPRDRYLSAHDVLLDLRKIDSSLRLRDVLTRSTQEIPSIAVLPFVNMSSDPENEFFCDGLAEELINGLCNLSELRVAARTSTFAFKGKDIDVKIIGDRLQVDHLLEGSVRKMGNQVRITVQLIKIEDGYHLWSDRYDRVLENVFEVQDELTLKILDVLKVQLFGQEKDLLLKRPTHNKEAYTIYLKSRFHWNRRTPQDLSQAIEYANQALSLDPDFAQAYSCLADCQVLMGLYGYQPGAEMYINAKRAAMKAIEIDPTLAEAYTSLGAARTFCDWDWNGAERACRNALALNPKYPTGHSFFAGFVLAAQGRPEEAINEITLAQHLDPFSFIIQTASAVIHWQAGLYEKAFEISSKVIEATPWFWLAHAVRGLVYEQWEQFDKAIESFKRANSLTGSNASTLGLGMLGHAFALAGKLEEAKRILDDLDHMENDTYVSPYDKAIIYIGLEDYQKAFEWLDRATVERSSWTVLINVDPRFSRIKTHAPFADIKESMRLN